MDRGYNRDGGARDGFPDRSDGGSRSSGGYSGSGSSGGGASSSAVGGGGGATSSAVLAELEAQAASGKVNMDGPKIGAPAPETKVDPVHTIGGVEPAKPPDRPPPPPTDGLNTTGGTQEVSTFSVWGAVTDWWSGSDGSSDNSAGATDATAHTKKL